MNNDLLQCRACPRLANFLDEVRTQQPAYHARPVIPFGVQNPRLLIVGLAPGMHGANRTGRPFTGDHAGILLYETLHQFGFASRPTSISADDGLELIGCRITNAVKCLPPANKPETSEIRQCNAYLKSELESLQPGTAVLALGNVAHAAVLMALGLKAKAHPFGHGAVHGLPSPPGRGAGGRDGGFAEHVPRPSSGSGVPAGTRPAREGALRLYDSYHCSRYNTQTRRLTAEMFHAVFARIVKDIKE